MATLLVYDDENRAGLTKCLSDRHDVTLVSTVEDGVRRLKERPFDMVLAAVYEENENVFLLLQHVRTLSNPKRIPFVCVRGPNATSAAREMDEAFRLATLMLGGRGYVAANDFRTVAPTIEQMLTSSA